MGCIRWYGDRVFTYWPVTAGLRRPNAGLYQAGPGVELIVSGHPWGGLTGDLQ
jgi:hypothetical protein